MRPGSYTLPRASAVLRADATIEDTRAPIDYEECGRGPSIVFAPGSCSTGAAWRPIISHCEAQFRCIATSLPGYGGTAERRSAADPSIAPVATALEVVIRRAGSPVHLVGHSFGGLAALAVALRGYVPLLSLTIVEAPAAQLLNAVGEHAHYRAFRAMTDAYFSAFAASEAGAIASMIDFYGGAGTFAGWPPRVRAYAIETTAVNILDWASAYSYQLSPAMLASLDLPVLVLRGSASHSAVKRANELISECLKDCRLATIEGAAHFLISTHAGAVAGLLRDHIGRVAAQAA
jgi:pimeloyl-ACP methyl ester carboxylesterase